MKSRISITWGRVRRGVRGAYQKLWDTLFLPLTAAAAWWLKQVRQRRIEEMPLTRWVFEHVGLYPLIDHYYEPLIVRSPLRSERSPRSLAGIDLNIQEQWRLVESFQHGDEMREFAFEGNSKDLHYFLGNQHFGPGDADCYYLLIRQIKPKRIIEVGSGHSTKIALAAIARNRTDDSNRDTVMTCIEPYRHADWFSVMAVEHLAIPLEQVPLDRFSALVAGDILFIDSSHIVRPGGDVLREVLTILPSLNSGVYVHIHDVFSPDDYPAEWLIEHMRFWNEQYLLEAFLTCNRDFEIVAALHHLFTTDRSRLVAALPSLARYDGRRYVSSFWLRRL